MTTTALTAADLQAQFASIFSQVNELLPNLPEPYKSSIDYVINVANNPAVDEVFCQQAGKVVQIAAELAEQIEDSVALRGENGPLTWDDDYNADKELLTPDFYSRTFTFHVPKEQMNDVISFKLVAPGRTPEEQIRWQTGKNCTVDLSKFGHIVNIKVSQVTFS